MAEFPPDFADLLLALLEAEARFMVVGGYAVAHYGHARATKDIDVWVCPGEDNADSVIRALRSFGAPLSILGVTRADFIQPGQTVQMGVPPLRIDLLTDISGVDFESAWTERQHFELAGQRIPIIGKRQLLVNKKASGRPQDLLDVQALEE